MRVVVVTISYSVARVMRRDGSGPALVERCHDSAWEVVSTEVVPDDRDAIEARLMALADSDTAELILTTGGTGLGPRDVTPEATAAICDRLIPGQRTPLAALSRAAAGLRGRTLIVNLPGNPKGAVESLDAIAAVLQHAVDVMHGARHD
jgi:molybdenum cofactor synthesis domain-containing protein